MALISVLEYVPIHQFLRMQSSCSFSWAARFAHSWPNLLNVRPVALAGELLTAASAVRPVPHCLPVAAYSNSRRQFDWSRPTGAASWSEPFWIVDRPEHRLPCPPFRSN
jgi:hypothetical protein